MSLLSRVVRRTPAPANPPPGPPEPTVPPEPPREVPSTLRHQMLVTREFTGGYDYFPYTYTQAVVTSDVNEAEMISSRLADDGGRARHAPILDLDVPATLIASSTTGHSHLYLDVPMSWRAYKRVLRALAKAGVIEKSWCRASISGRATLLSPPWRRKAAAR